MQYDCSVVYVVYSMIVVYVVYCMIVQEEHVLYQVFSYLDISNFCDKL